MERAAQQVLVEFRGARRAEVIVEEGSIRLMGLIIVGLELLAKFGEIRSGLDYALHDGKAAAGWINEHVQKRRQFQVKTLSLRENLAPLRRSCSDYFERSRAVPCLRRKPRNALKNCFTTTGKAKIPFGPLWSGLRGRFGQFRKP